MNVLNVRLNSRGSVRSHVECSPGALLGFWAQRASASLSARKRALQVRQSTSGSVNPLTCPEASHTRGCIRIAASIPSMSSRAWTIARHHRSLTLRFSSTPRGP